MQTLPQRLYLLCYTVDKSKFEAVDLQGRGQLLRAGALAELAFTGLLGTGEGKVVRLDAPPPADPFLADVWRDLPPDKPAKWLEFLHAKAHTAERPVRDQLVAAGAVTPPAKRTWSPLGSHKVTVNDPESVLALQRRARTAVLAYPDPAAVPPDELAMAVLATECEVTTVLTGKERREHKRTLKALAARFDDAVPGLRRALRDSFLSSRGTGGGWGR
ncbi:GPP34 family phosphoprotein [Actinomadura sp. WMMB 499]|uniref:GOLPH3/VPS74 family protein n=1 Tax=Actinomadura sp. WMMB 499 TaxID=1219491 RepID=UPI001246BE4B|nr:GPP34 family phosphoprotein [Actinomadura sp. WMMB 499]QFG22313.1 GPP34 family phosphoprotein [Actinomadura sp. WMMB 499]